MRPRERAGVITDVVVFLLVGFLPSCSPTNEPSAPVRPAPVSDDGSYFPCINGAVWVYAMPNPTAHAVGLEVVWLVPYQRIAEAIQLIAVQPGPLPETRCAEQIHHLVNVDGPARYAIVTYGMSFPPAGKWNPPGWIRPPGVEETWKVHELHSVNGDLAWQLGALDASTVTQVSKRIAPDKVSSRPVPSPFHDGTTSVASSEEVSVVIDGRRFSPCRMSSGRSVWGLYARGVGLLGLYMSAHDSPWTDKEMKRGRKLYYTPEFPELVRVNSIAYYYLPGQRPIEFTDDTWLRKDSAGHLMLNDPGRLRL